MDKEMNITKNEKNNHTGTHTQLANNNTYCIIHYCKCCKYCVIVPSVLLYIVSLLCNPRPEW